MEVFKANESADLKETENPENVFTEGQKRIDSFKNRVKINNTGDAVKAYSFDKKYIVLN